MWGGGQWQRHSFDWDWKPPSTTLSSLPEVEVPGGVCMAGFCGKAASAHKSGNDLKLHLELRSSKSPQSIVVYSMPLLAGLKRQPRWKWKLSGNNGFLEQLIECLLTAHIEPLKPQSCSGGSQVADLIRILVSQHTPASNDCSFYRYLNSFCRHWLNT